MTGSKFSRRSFLSMGTALGAGAFLGQKVEARGQDDFSSYSRYKPSFGGPPDDNDNYMGKLMPGLRGSGLPPVSVTCPDLEKLPFKMSEEEKNSS